jgi:uncharacterized membrane protein YeaQ/YmgE (transglycosylase-associated protein family)
MSRWPGRGMVAPMSLLALIVVLAVWGLIVGALARWAVPGPDPMSIWRTMLLGIAGTFVGLFIGRLLGFTGGGLLFGILGGVLLLILWRKFIEKRPLTGPGARFPAGRRRGP